MPTIAGDLSKKPLQQRELLLALGMAYYRLEGLVSALRAAQCGIRQAEALWVPGEPAARGSEELLAGLEGVSPWFRGLAAEYFERFQETAFAFVEPELGLSDIRGSHLDVTRTKAGRQRSFPSVRYARLDFDPAQCGPTTGIALHVSEDVDVNATPEQARPWVLKGWHHRYQNEPIIEATYRATLDEKYLTA